MKIWSEEFRDKIDSITDEEAEILWEQAYKLSENKKLKIILNSQKELIKHRILDFLIPEEKHEDERLLDMIDTWVLNSLDNISEDCDVLDHCSTADLIVNEKIIKGKYNARYI